MKSQQTKAKAILVVTKTHQLKKPSNNPSSSKRHSILSHTSRPSGIPLQSIEKPFDPLASSPPVLGDSSVISALREQREDIDRIDAGVGRLQKDMQDVRFFMENVRREMAEIRSTCPVTENDMGNSVSARACEVNDLRLELASLRTRIKDMEIASRNADVSKSGVAFKYALPIDSQELQSPQESVSNERACKPPTGMVSQMTAHNNNSTRKRRYSEGEYNQAGASFGQSKRRKQRGHQQEEASESLLISPSPDYDPIDDSARISQSRTESPILGQYNQNGDTGRVQQDDDIQSMEQDDGRHIPESPSQQIEYEMNTPDERSENDKNRHSRNISQASSNQIPESPQERPSSKHSDLSSKIAIGYPFTSHPNLPQIVYQSPYEDQPQSRHQSPYQSPNLQAQPQPQYQSPCQPLEIPNSSQSQATQTQPSQEVSEPQLPTLPNRTRGRPKGSKNLAVSVTIAPTSEELSASGRALRRRTIPALGSNPSSAAKPQSAEVATADTPRNNIMIDLTGNRIRECGMNGEVQEIGGSPNAQFQVQIHLDEMEKEKDATLGPEEETNKVSIFQDSNSAKRARRNTRRSHHRLSVDDLNGEKDKENEDTELELDDPNMSPLVRIQTRDRHSALIEDVEIEDQSQDSEPRRKQRSRRNTRSSRHKPSVDLDATLTERDQDENDIEFVDENVNEMGGNGKKRGKRDGRFSSGSKELVKNQSGDFIESGDEKKRRGLRERESGGNQDRDRGGNREKDGQRGVEEESEDEKEDQRGRNRERGRRNEHRRKSTRRRELELREEMVKQALGLELGNGGGSGNKY